MPRSIAVFAPSRTSTGTSVSQTPWARLMPRILSHSTDMTRISDCSVCPASLLSDVIFFAPGFGACDPFLLRLIPGPAQHLARQRCSLLSFVNYRNAVDQHILHSLR